MALLRQGFHMDTTTIDKCVGCYDEGWRPRRTILFCSWGASEQGYMGATEWIEEHLSLLGARAVAHMNVDIAVVRALFVSGFPCYLLC